MAIAPLLDVGAPVYNGEGVDGATPIARPATAAPAIAPAGKTVNVIAPDGKVFGLDANYLAQAQAQGYQVESAEHAGIRSWVEKNRGIGGAAAVAAKSLLNEATFGVSDPLIERAWDPYQNARFKALEEEHKGASIAGSVAGFGTSLLYGGPLFKGAAKAGGVARAAMLGAEKTLAAKVAAEAAYRAGAEGATALAKHTPGIARQIIASAADYGVQGAFFSAPKAAAQAIVGDPDKAAETFLWGAVGGAALGGVAGAVGGAASKLLARRGAPAAEAAAEGAIVKDGDGLMGRIRSWADKTADKQAFRSLASNEASLGKVVKDLELQFGDDAADKAGRYLRENGLVKQFGASARDESTRFAKNVAAEGRAVGGFWQAADGRFGDAARLDVGELSTKIRDKALRPLYEESFGMEGLAESLGKKLDSFDRMAMSKSVDGKISLADAHALQRQFDKHIKFSALNSAEQDTINTVMADARRALNRELLGKVESQGGVEALAEIKGLNERFAIAKAIAKGAKDYVTREGKNRVASPTDYLGALAGVFMGGSPVVGAVGGLAAGYAHHVVRTEGNALASRALGGFGEGRGLSVLEGAFAKHDSMLSTIPNVLERMSSGGGASPARETMGVNILTRFLEAHDAKLDDSKGVMQFADKMASLASDPTRMEQRVQEALAPLGGEVPEVATAVAAKLPQIAGYLASAAPKSPYAANMPFAPKPMWKPTDAQVKDYKTKVAVALDPYKAIDALGDGTLTKAHVDALRVVAPKLYDEMLKRITDYGSTGEAKPLPFAQRLKLSMMTGAPLDRSLAQIATSQAVYQTAASAKVDGQGMKKNPGLQTSDIARVAG